MLKLFASNQTIVLVLIPIFVVVHSVFDYFFPSSFFYDNAIDGLWQIPFHEFPLIVRKFGAGIMVTLSAFIINTIFNQHEFFEKNTYLPSLLYLILVSFFPFSVNLAAENFGHLFFILSIQQLLFIRQNEDAKNQVFLASLFLGMASTFLPMLLSFLLFVWISLWLIRPFAFREFVLSILGLLVPFLWLVLINQQVLFNEKIILEELPASTAEKVWNVFLLVFILLTLLTSLLLIRKRMSQSSVRFKRIMNVCFIILIYSMFFLTISSFYFNTYGYLSISIPVLCILLPYSYLDLKNKIIPSILYYGLFVAVIAKFFS